MKTKKNSDARNVSIEQKKKKDEKALSWMLGIILVALTIMSLYELFVLKKDVLTQFAIVSALSGTLMTRISFFKTKKYLIAIPIIIAVVLMGLEIFSSLVK